MERLVNRLCAMLLSVLLAAVGGFLLCCLVITLWDYAGLRHGPGVTVGWMCAGLAVLAGVFVGVQSECA